MDRERKAEARRKHAALKQRAAQEREQLRQERSDSFEAGGAAAAAAEEEKKLDEEEKKEESEAESDPEPEPEADDVDMAEEGARGVRARANRSQFSVVSKSWSVSSMALAATLSITPAQLAENATLNFKRHEAQDRPWNVDFLCEQAIALNKVKNVDEALTYARRYAAFLLAANPLLRREVRKHYLEHGELSTVPTAKGVRELDATHEYESVRRLVHKPLQRMAEHPAQFLLMHQAERGIHHHLVPSATDARRDQSHPVPVHGGT